MLVTQSFVAKNTILHIIEEYATTRNLEYCKDQIDEYVENLRRTVKMVNS